MKLMCPARRFSTLFLPVLFIILLLTSAGFPERRTRATRRPVAKKSQRSLKVARKELKKERPAAGRRDSRKENRVAKQRDRDTRLSAKDKRRLAQQDKKDSKKSRAELRKAEVERRRIEAERRRAALAEQRRREEAARQARLRQIAFENGLKQETRENIAKDNADGEDPQVRAAAVNALGNRAGTVVVMEAQTGKVVTIVNQDWAIRNSFKPCSTIKLVTGVAGLNENIIDSEGHITNSSMSMPLVYALAKSNNAYFQRVGINMGSTKMVQYARMLGLGEKTGINAEGETPGKVPFNNNNARIYSHGDDFEVTPLQLAVLVSSLSNGGEKVVPQIARPHVERTAFTPMIQRTVSLPQRSIEGVLPGMMGAAEFGTAHR